VTAEFIDGRLPGGAGVIDDFHDAFQPGALPFQQRRYQFARSRANLFVRYFINALNKVLNSPNTILKSLGCWIFHGSYSPISWITAICSLYLRIASDLYGKTIYQAIRKFGWTLPRAWCARMNRACRRHSDFKTKALANNRSAGLGQYKGNIPLIDIHQVASFL